MEQREAALREALLKNENETERWELYKKENQDAIDNLDRFSKHLVVDVMVPIGSKAYMPGQLIHTNEILVGHYQGYFSKCSAHKAKEICEHRISMADEQLKRLQTEAELWENKLNIPFLEGALPNADERDIIEDYDEEKEKQWREEHKERVRVAKLMEKENKAKNFASEKEKTDEEIFQMLEESEMMEELQNELDSLEVGELSEETINQLISGEMKVPPKNIRLAHNMTDPENSLTPTQDHKKEATKSVVKRSDVNASVMSNVTSTNNKFQINPEVSIGNDSDDSVDDGVGDDDSKLLDERQIIKGQVTSEQELEKKIHMYEVMDHLMELLEIEGDSLELESAESDDDELLRGETEGNEKLEPSPKRRISFAIENQTIEFNEHGVVADMMPKPTSTNGLTEKKRDTITLGAAATSETVGKVTPPPPKKKDLLEKVTEQIKTVSQQQSKQDFDLVDRILASSSENKSRTLHITFEHSKQLPVELLTLQEDRYIPGTPADLYDYLKTIQNQKENVSNVIYTNSYDGEAEVKVPIMSAAQRKVAYVDPKAEFSIPHGGTKSILRNKSAVMEERHILVDHNDENKPAKSQKKKMKSKAQEEIYISAYEKVMNDVIEKVAPDPLPQENFIDAHAPKKRISRFKQMRTATRNT